MLAENLLLFRAVEADRQLQRRRSIGHRRFFDHDHRLHRYTMKAGQGMLMQIEASVRTARVLATQQEHRARGASADRAGGLT
jgi:hypothetical protein